MFDHSDGICFTNKETIVEEYVRLFQYKLITFILVAIYLAIYSLPHNSLRPASIHAVESDFLFITPNKTTPQKGFHYIAFLLMHEKTSCIFVITLRR